MTGPVLLMFVLLVVRQFDFKERGHHAELSTCEDFDLVGESRARMKVMAFLCLVSNCSRLPLYQPECPIFSQILFASRWSSACARLDFSSREKRRTRASQRNEAICPDFVRVFVFD